MTPVAGSVRIPSWAIATIVALGITLAGGLITLGKASQRIDNLDERLSAMTAKQDKDISEIRKTVDEIYRLLLAMNK